MQLLSILIILSTVGCTTYPTCPVPMEADKGYLKWDKTRGEIEADSGGKELFVNYIAARNVCGG